MIVGLEKGELLVEDMQKSIPFHHPQYGCSGKSGRALFGLKRIGPAMAQFSTRIFELQTERSRDRR